MIIQTIRMKSVTAEGMGTLSVFEAEHDVPFAIKRIYYIHNVPAGVQRGANCCGAPTAKFSSNWMTDLKRLKLCWTAPTKA